MVVVSEKTTHFAIDTMAGLKARNKYLHPKYFYDARGSEIFRNIMRMPEYYLTRCEYEIMETQSDDICAAIPAGDIPLEIIELGPGDGLKSVLLLQSIATANPQAEYIPYDISRSALGGLVEMIHEKLPRLDVNPVAGDFFDLNRHFTHYHPGTRVILFLGSNIGNFQPAELAQFMGHLDKATQPGDHVLIGFDLKKPAEIVLPAYNDRQGYTAAFNLNYLHRINREMDADFDLGNFIHRPRYNPITGHAESYLVATRSHEVYIGMCDESIFFEKGEAIFMELSRKYDFDEINQLALASGFMIKKNFLDSKGYFADSLWVKQYPL